MLAVENLSLAETDAKKDVEDELNEKTFVELVDEGMEKGNEAQIDESATVHIGQDSSYISLSACNYNHLLINYLKTHPLTMK